VSDTVPDCEARVSNVSIVGVSPRLHTVSVIVKVCELVAPLRYYAQRILEESDNNQEAANCWEVAIRGFS
jgi:hypothetical protein